MSRRILLVDDERELMMPMKIMLEEAGLIADFAETYEQAMSRLNNEQYSAVILDVRLGGVYARDGLVILDFVRTHLPGIQAIVMTGYGGPEIMKEAYRLNAHYYFEKPIPFNKLSDALYELGVLL